jgi:hypothetical protein
MFPNYFYFMVFYDLNVVLQFEQSPFPMHPPGVNVALRYLQCWLREVTVMQEKNTLGNMLWQEDLVVVSRKVHDFPERPIVVS